VRGDKQKAVGKKERACRNHRKEGKKAAGRLKNALTHSERVSEREDTQGETKMEIKARK
jgi:hypothetical protein